MSAIAEEMGQEKKINAMKPSIMVADDFFEFPLGVRASLLGGKFEDFKSPVDGVVYPGINSAPEKFIQDLLGARLAEIMGRDVEVQFVFARLTLADTKVPHRVHSDRIMGDYSAHVYMSLDWPDGTGTGFWRHEKFGLKDEGVASPEEVDLCGFKGWTPNFGVQGKFNRLVIHDARLWHNAAGAWGSTPSDGRLVLTAFFK